MSVANPPRPGSQDGVLVVDSYGGDPRACALLWARATYVVWLDLPLTVTAWRAVMCSLRRS